MEERYDVKTIKSEDFALRIVNLYKYLKFQKGEDVLSKQILRSGTSIGANIAEANCSESDYDFVHKLSISQKEANETLFWLKLLFKSQYIDEVQYKDMYKDCEELLRILSSIIVAKKAKLK